MSYFVKQEIEGKPGEFEYVEVEPSAVELPEDELAKRVFTHPKFKQVVDESKGRKEKIRKMQDELKALEGDDGEPVKTEQAQGQQKPAEAPQPLDEDALYAKFMKRLKDEQSAEEQKKTEAEKRLRAIADKHGLGAAALPVLARSTDPEAVAALLEENSYRFDDQEGGEPSAPDKDALQSKILSKLGLEDNKD